MTMLEILALVTQLLLPAVLLLWIALRRRRSRSVWTLDVSIVAAYLLAISLASPWLVFPWYLPAVFAVALLTAAAVGWSRIRTPIRPDRRLLGRVELGIKGLVTVLFAAVAVVAISGRQGFPETPVDLAFPLRQGAYLVANGGSVEIVNPHIVTRSGERYRAYRGQSYAVDIVKVGAWGSRRRGLSPEEPDEFAIFGDPIHAPCSGVVVRAADGFVDRLPAGAEPATLEGNHVMLECGAVWILLAHMRQGSVEVAEGDTVAAGDVLGQVGNSGNSGEPHLHIHAQTPGTRMAPLGGDPVPVTFDGRHLVRNDRVRSTGSSPS